MRTATWGLLGPESQGNLRRTRTLNLGACVRSFNDLAVPGLGGVWFGKQLFLATLGVAVAEQACRSDRQVTNIETANAIEALACWLALDDRNWRGDPRVRGATKMRLKKDLRFLQLRKPSFYVTQPMRQSTIQPLLALGLVESASERFNGFSCSTDGKDFIDAVCRDEAGDVIRPFNTEVIKHLVRWVTDETTKVDSQKLTKALSPISTMSPLGCEFLRARLRGNGDANSKRRDAALRWVAHVYSNPETTISWDTKPAELDDEHWRDIRVGGRFFVARDAAIKLLDKIEVHIGNQSSRSMSLRLPLPDNIALHCEELRTAAQTFLDDGFDGTTSQDATTFCRQCVESSFSRVIASLLEREGRVLQQKGDDVVPGPAFKDTPLSEPETARSDEESGLETTLPETIKWPLGISHRIRSLYLLNLDLNGELDSELNQSMDVDGVA